MHSSRHAASRPQPQLKPQMQAAQTGPAGVQKGADLLPSRLPGRGRDGGDDKAQALLRGPVGILDPPAVCWDIVLAAQQTPITQCTQQWQAAGGLWLFITCQAPIWVLDRCLVSPGLCRYTL